MTLLEQKHPFYVDDYIPKYEMLATADVDELITQATDLLLQCKEQLHIICSKTITDNSLLDIEQTFMHMQRTFSPIDHIVSVSASERNTKLREALNVVYTDIATEFFQTKEYYDRFITLFKKCKKKTPKYRIVDSYVEEFKDSGVALDVKKQKQFKKIIQEINKLESAFGNNVVQCKDAFSVNVPPTQKDKLKGLNGNDLSQLASNAKAAGKKGWNVDLTNSSVIAILQRCENRALRKKIHKAYSTVASDIVHNKKYDNTKLRDRLLVLKTKQAKLLGYKSYAALSTAEKMARTPQSVIDFFDSFEYVHDASIEERKELAAFAKAKLGINKLQPHDIAFVSERLREEQYSFSSEEVSNYFQLDTVMKGLFNLIENMYNIKFTRDRKIETWNDTVMSFVVSNKDDGTRIGVLQMDLFSRANKSGGAWMNDPIPHHETSSGHIQDALIYVVCNFKSPQGKLPSLLTHSDVITIFHEMGHAMHGMFMKSEYVTLSSVGNVEWDTVELPSQFMENFCWDFETINKISKHYKTGKKMPRELFDKIVKARNFCSASQLSRQLEFSAIDMELHSKASKVNVNTTIDKIRNDFNREYADYDRFINSFTHIFDGGYSAGYYSYLWAEVLSADVFSIFEEQGIYNQPLAMKLKADILEVGAAEEMEDCVIRFLGREPNPEALFRHRGVQQ